MRLVILTLLALLATTSCYCGADAPPRPPKAAVKAEQPFTPEQKTALAR